jgi:hypothetical protein
MFPVIFVLNDQGPIQLTPFTSKFWPCYIFCSLQEYNFPRSICDILEIFTRECFVLTYVLKMLKTFQNNV